MYHCSSVMAEVRTVPTFFCSSSKFSLTEFQLVPISAMQYCNSFLPCPATLLCTFFPLQQISKICYNSFKLLTDNSALTINLEALHSWWGLIHCFFQEARMLQHHAVNIRYYITSKSNVIISTENRTIPNYSLLVFFKFTKLLHIKEDYCTIILKQNMAILQQ